MIIILYCIFRLSVFHNTLINKIKQKKMLTSKLYKIFPIIVYNLYYINKLYFFLYNLIFHVTSSKKFKCII